MILSRSKPAGDIGGSSTSGPGSAKKSFPELEDFLLKRDYIGASTLLEFMTNEGESNVWLQLWSAFCSFHLGDYRKALDIYLKVQHSSDAKVKEDLAVNLAVCYFYLGMYNESQEATQKAIDSPLKTRLLFHLAHKLNDEDGLMEQHQRLRDVPEDQLCLASIHYLRGHYQEAIDVYKKLLLDKRNNKKLHMHEIEWLKVLSKNGTYLALNVYVALCYYKLDYYDVSQEVLGVYLNQFPDSTVAVNLKACNLFRLYNGKSAEQELKAISSDQHSFGQDLVKHNLVVFRNGEGALKVLPQLVDVVPEARLNLAGWRLRAREPREAQALLTDLTPTSPLHYILRGVIAASLANETNDEKQLKTAQQSFHAVGSSASECDTIPGRQCMASSYFLRRQKEEEEQLKTAQQSFHAVGSSASECDTIPGRQCMASSYFLRRQHEEVLVYLNSIKSFFSGDDVFNFNYAQAKVSTGFYKEAEECLLSIQDENIRNSYTYLACLCRCYIMNKQGQAAWELCAKMAGTPDSFALLQLVANDCYRMGLFIVAARAFNMLDRLEPNPEFWEGLRGACAGAVQAAAAGLAAGARAGSGAAGADVREAVALLRSASHTQADNILRVVTRWAHDNRIPV